MGLSIQPVDNLFQFALSLINDYLVPLVFALAFIIFLFGVYRYFISNGGNEEKVKEGQKFVMWSIVGFVLMFSIWGIINLFLDTLGFNSQYNPGIPQFTNMGDSAPYDNSPGGYNGSAPGGSPTPGSAPGGSPTPGSAPGGSVDTTSNYYGTPY